MKNTLLHLTFLIFVFAFVSSANSQVDERRWVRIDPRSLPAVDNNSTLAPSFPYAEVDNTPQEVTYRYEATPNGIFAVSSSRRILSQRTSNTATQSEVYITRHPLNPMIMFASANTYPVYNSIISEGVYVTTNGGANWFGSDSTADTQPGNHVGDPGPMIDKNGVFINSHLRYNYGTGQITGMDASYSTNNGTTWLGPVTLQAVSVDKNLSGTDDAPTSPYYGRSYVVWSRFNASLPPIAISYTANGGVSWSGAVDINASASGHYSQGCDIRVGPNGEVYVVWANPVAASPFTEDFCGFAKSTNGSASWVINTNNAFDMNGIRGTLPTKNNIRVNSFPRIDVDRTCGPYAGYIYVVVSQKNLAPAGTDADIVIHRSTDGGTTWSAGVRVNQDALNNGKLQWFPCVRVDESGAVNVFYYDDRNVAGTLEETYLSRSTDGGQTFTDVKVSDHSINLTSIPGLATGYTGDYMGITSGNGKIWCNWMDPSQLSKTQSWIASVDVTIPTICEDFSCSYFPPSTMLEEFSGTNYWSKQAPSAFGSGSGSAMFNAWSATVGTSQSLASYTLASLSVPGQYLTFDEAYAPWSGGNVDSLIVETSLNAGVSYTALARLWGGLGAQAGPLNTVFDGGGEFTPANHQWRTKIYALPVGTNRIRLRAVSGFGNDIWVDNVCIKTLPAPVVNSIGIVPEGYYRALPSPHAVAPDTVRMYLHRTDYPNVVVDSATDVFSTFAVATALNFANAQSGAYYKVIRHRNCIETWSKAGGEVYTRGSNTHYNFIQPSGQAYGNNQKLIDIAGYYGMYGGEVFKDSVIDLSDITAVYNDANAFISGYVITDITGDDFVDLSDLTITYNNANAFVTRVAPPGGEPDAVQTIAEVIKNTKVTDEVSRQKLEKTIEIMKQQQQQQSQIIPKKKISMKEGLELIKAGKVDEMVKKVMSTWTEDQFRLIEESRKNANQSIINNNPDSYQSGSSFGER